jgi:hypothetical protein
MNSKPPKRWFISAAIAALILGAILSRVIDPGVCVEKRMLTTNTPALRLFPATPGSKEMMFRFGEALAAAGFDCYSVDLAGFGESPQTFSFTNLLRNFQELKRVLAQWMFSSAIRWAVAVGVCLMRDFALSSLLESASRSSWASMGRRRFYWEVYLRNFFGQPSSEHEQRRSTN